jgi:hypothetical protein
MKKTIEINEIDKMVFVATLPRSGSSMNCGILELCGAFGGDTIGSVPANPKGIYENRGLNQMILRPILQEMGIKGSRGFYTLARVGGPPADLFEGFYEDMSYGMNRQGYEGGVAYFKNGIITFLFDRINEVFPNATWLLPMRDDEGVIFSNKRIHPDRNPDGVKREIEDYHKMYDHIQEVAGDRAHILDNDALMGGDTAQMKGIIEELGLVWDGDAVDEWIDPDLWGDNGKREPFFTDVAPVAVDVAAPQNKVSGNNS